VGIPIGFVIFMSRQIMRLIYFLLLICAAHWACAETASVSPAPSLDAKAYLLYDYTSNQILVNQNGDARVEPASLTKMMTAYLTFIALKQNKLTLRQEILPNVEAIRPQGEESRMFLDAAQHVSVADLLRGLIVQSGNDAARVLAETIATNETSFAEQMNAEAQRLGMHNTHFVNATGLPNPQHYSSAYDLALLAAAIVRDFPQHYPLYALREFQYNNIKQFNRNRLLWLDPYVDGMKTGHTDTAGFCLVSSAKREGHRLISVLLGAPSDALRASESQRLLNYGFQSFEVLKLYSRNQEIRTVRVWKGTENHARLTSRSDIYVTIPVGQRAQLNASIETHQPILAPLENGQALGALKLALNGKPYLDFPLASMDSVPLANVFSRGVDSLRLWLQALWHKVRPA
jgi:serine-type D-Ala-D-Ala carboxypeptidase (penicillin-binding protein 5/6)